MSGVEGIDDFDIDRAIAHAWAEFATRLAEVLSMVDDSGDLTIGTPSSDGAPDCFLTFSTPARDRLRCEAGMAADRTQDEQVAALLADGWERSEAGEEHPAGVVVVAAECPQEESETMAELAVRALRDVFGVQHPVFLAPDQLAEVLQPDAADLSSSSKSEDSFAGRV
ncbi:MAG: TY-Chap domain-containing protein, partial [Janthinobacterium lividum]